MFGRQAITTSYHFMQPREKGLAQSRIHYKRISNGSRSSYVNCKISEIYLKQDKRGALRTSLTYPDTSNAYLFCIYKLSIAFHFLVF